MIISSDTPPRRWTSVEAKTLRDFLKSDAGQLALEWVAYKSPELLDGENKNKTLVASGEVKGYHGALAALWNLTVEQPSEAKTPEAYPSIDDESAWAHLETEKLTQNPT
jgi:hypothetical protein